MEDNENTTNQETHETNGQQQEDVSGLKSALQKEREARKDLERQLKLTAERKAEEEKKQLEEKEQWKDLAARQKQELADLHNKIVTTERQDYARKIVGNLTKDSKKSKLLSEQILKYVKYNDGSIQIEGLPGVETGDQLADWAKSEFGFLVDGSQATGGGAASSDGAGSAVKTIKDSAFMKLNHAERMAKVKEGYQIIPD